VTLPKGELTSTTFQILLSLTDGERHGYSIMRDIAERTEGQTKVGAATLYRSIKRMVDDGLISESEERPDPELDDQRRRYYRLTSLGEQAARTEAQRLSSLVESAYRKRLIERDPGVRRRGMAT
jgi:DNA-binding PadR family transcriptional regulator